MPDLDDSDIVSYERLETEAAEAILEYNKQFDYVTREFAEFAMIWGLLLRLGDVRSLDLDDYDREEGYITLSHDPEEDTPLKNGEGEYEHQGGERQLNVPDWLCEILNVYIDGTDDPRGPQRIDSVDDFGRKPLFTTQYGRVSRTTLRRDLYRVTQPCQYGESCPHNMDPGKCDSATKNNLLSKCLSNVSPHPVRRGAICHQLNEGVPKDTICDRADVTRKVLNRHYDLRTNEEARKDRREVLKQHLEGYGDSPQESNKYQSPLIQMLPTFRDVIRDKDDYLTSLGNTPSRARMVHGSTLYAIFVALLGVDFALMGLQV
ncbi:site-specific integrase [Halomicroarcula sp. GCM10025710]